MGVPFSGLPQSDTERGRVSPPGPAIVRQSRGFSTISYVSMTSPSWMSL